MRDTFKATNENEPLISDIIISHWHHDHVGGLPGVLNLLRKLWQEKKPSRPYIAPRLHKFPLPPGEKLHSHSNIIALDEIAESLPRDLFTPAADGGVFHPLADAQVLGPSGVRVLHTPGHTVDSIALYIPDDHALYTADTVLGHGTAIFEDLGTYLKSLTRMLNFGKNGGTDEGEYVVLYPGHGAVVSNGRELIATYIQHRLEREEQVVGLLKSPPSSKESLTDSGEPVWSTWTIVKSLYASYPENLWLPAAHGIDLHLKKLEAEGRVKRVAGEGKDTKWQFV